MNTVAYIKKYSQLYKDFKSDHRDELAELDAFMPNFTYVKRPSRAMLPAQIELHMFWRIPIPDLLVASLEFWIEQGVFFKSNPDVYYYVDKKYWSLVKYNTGAALDCRSVNADDFTYSMELYKKAPWHFDLTELNYNSLECLEQVTVKYDRCKVIDFKCLEYIKSKKAQPIFSRYVQFDMLKCLKHNVGLEFRTWAYDMCVRMLIRHGDVEALRCHFNHYMEDYTSYVSSRGQIECIKYISTVVSPASLMVGVERALINGHVEYVKYMYGRNAFGVMHAAYKFMEHPATPERFEVFKFIYKHCKLKPYLMDLAVTYGNLLYIKHMQLDNIPLPDTCTPVNSRCVKYLYKRCCRPLVREDTNVVSYRIIKYIYEQTGALNWINDRILNNLSLKSVRYIYEKGYRAPNMLDQFVQRRSISIIEYLYKQGERSDYCMREAVCSRNIHLVSCMYKLGIPWSITLREPIINNDIRLVKYMYTRGARYNSAIECAVKHNAYETFVYLHSKGESWGDSLLVALNHCALKCLRFMLTNGVDFDPFIERARIANYGNVADYLTRVKIGGIDCMFMNVPHWGSCPKMFHKNENI